MKQCRKCLSSKPLEDFNIRTNSRHYNICRTCSSADNKIYHQKRKADSFINLRMRINVLGDVRACKICLRTKSISEFYTSPRGKIYKCKSCTRARSTELRPHKKPLRRLKREYNSKGILLSKECSKCGLVKTSDLFSTRRRLKEGISAWCKSCHIENQRRNKDKQTEYWLRSRYGISAEQMAEKLKSQGGVCEICKRVPTRFVVDHDHQSENVRGIICQPCNVMLGGAKDDIETLRSGVIYLVKYNSIPKHQATHVGDPMMLPGTGDFIEEPRILAFG